MKMGKTWVFGAALALALPGLAQAGQQEGLDAFARKDWATAAREFEPLAKDGDTVALSRLGHLHLRGLGMPRDVTEGIRLLTLAADQGDALAQNTLGGLYFRGTEVGRDLERALELFERAAGQNQPNALNNLGQLYFVGKGVPKNETKALTYLHRAADLGIPAAWETIGIAYWRGRGVPTDHQAALPWLKKAAERGQMAAQNLYGAALWAGDGVGLDRAEALRWFEKAAAQGDPASAFNLAQAKQAGVGTDKDPEEAYYYYTLAERLARPGDKERYGAARAKARAQLSPEQEMRAVQRAALWKRGQTPAADTDGLTDGDSPKPDAKATLKAPTRPKTSSGSGFVINAEGVVLTNAHVVRSCKSINISLGEGSTAEAASVLARDVDNDIAALQTQLRPRVGVHLRDDKPLRPGDNVVAIGFPLSSLLSREPNVTAGVISALNGLHGDPRHFQLTAPIQRGNSGGPLVDASGNVVGMVVSTLNAIKLGEKEGGAIPQNVNFAIKAELLRKFLDGNHIAYHTAHTGPTLSTADVGERLRPATALITCEK